jgi:predicted transcriptional regulator
MTNGNKEDKRAKALELKQKGFDAKQIAESLGITKQYVYMLVGGNGHITPETKERILSLHKSGLSIPNIAIQLGLQDKTIYRVLDQPVPKKEKIVYKKKARKRLKEKKHEAKVVDEAVNNNFGKATAALDTLEKLARFREQIQVFRESQEKLNKEQYEEKNLMIAEVLGLRSFILVGFRRESRRAILIDFQDYGEELIIAAALLKAKADKMIREMI